MQPDDSTKPVVVREPDASKDARPVLRGGSSREARSLPSNPAFEQARTRFVEGLAHFGAARWAEAEQSFEAALALMPGRPSVLTNLGATRLRLGRPAVEGQSNEHQQGAQAVQQCSTSGESKDVLHVRSYSDSEAQIGRWPFRLSSRNDR